MNRVIFYDNCGRRIGGERRAFSYTIHIPERRSGSDRRCGSDRRAERYKKENNAVFKRRFE